MQVVLDIKRHKLHLVEIANVGGEEGVTDSIMRLTERIKARLEACSKAMAGTPLRWLTNNGGAPQAYHRPVTRELLREFYHTDSQPVKATYAGIGSDLQFECTLIRLHFHISKKIWRHVMQKYIVPAMVEDTIGRILSIKANCA